jgi:L-lactate dehydrogenase (cytochrome)
MSLGSVLTIGDLKARARTRVPRMFFDYAESGSWTEATFRANESDFADISFRQRVAVDLRDRSLKSTMVGREVSLPLAVAPAASCGLQSPDGEIRAARAAEAFGIPYSLSMMSFCSIEDVAEAVATPFWLQVYKLRDTAFMDEYLQRARAARCSALILTLDRPYQGARHIDLRNGLRTPFVFNLSVLSHIAARPGWAFGMLGAKRWTFSNVVGHANGVTDVASLSRWVADQFDLNVSWSVIDWAKERFDGPVIVKGILDVEDARAAVAQGADAIVVSNHGGRQLDGAPSSIRVLSEIVEAVGHKTEVLMDGGIRSGQDLLKALALGAKGAFIGRPILYGLGAGGEAGVTRALEIIRTETDITMALLGERDIRNVGPHNIYRNGLARRQGHQASLTEVSVSLP